LTALHKFLFDIGAKPRLP